MYHNKQKENSGLEKYSVISGKQLQWLRKMYMYSVHHTPHYPLVPPLNTVFVTLGPFVQAVHSVVHFPTVLCGAAHP